MVGQGIACAGLYLATAWLAIEGNDYAILFGILTTLTVFFAKWSIR